MTGHREYDIFPVVSNRIDTKYRIAVSRPGFAITYSITTPLNFTEMVDYLRDRYGMPSMPMPEGHQILVHRESE